MRSHCVGALLVAAACCAGCDLAAQTPSRPDPEALAELVSSLDWRSIGPAEMGGRTVDIAAIPGDPRVVYFATASGGLWQTPDGGITWRSLFESGGTLSLGAVTLAPSDPNVVYLGTGEHNPRNSTSIGDGVYRSTDAGETWTHVGLSNTERIARIRVHPRDPDLVYVGAMGHLWGPNAERGVYRSRDGGGSWERVLFIDEDTGVADLVMNPANPRILFASMWDFRRQPWHFRSGGPGSGLYRSKDGGDTWELLTNAGFENGLPEGTLGRIGLAIAASNPRVVFAIIESESDGVLWRSEDGGENWDLVSSSQQIGGRPFYYHDIRVDPTDENTLYALAGGLHKSIDGGRTWRRIASNIHGDHQALWIDPLDSDRVINGNDGGFHFSPDGGETWEFANTVPLAQFYQIGVDNRVPYTVCGGLQDNDAWCGPSRTLNVSGSLQNYWHEIIGPGDGMYVQFDPTNPDVAYTNTQGGNLFRVDLSTGEARSIRPYPPNTGGAGADVHPYRFHWNAPVHMSPHDPETVFFGGNVLFRTRDRGQTWDEISPDLTRAEPEKMISSGGPLTPDNSTAEIHATIYSISESPVESGVIWVGTDDGNVQLTRDGGATWTDLTANVAGLLEVSWISRVEASPHRSGAAYITVDRRRVDDMRPYVFKTSDYGASWVNITDNLPTPGYAHVVREDPRNPDLVYVGTELGIWASIIGGGEWFSLRGSLPPVAVRDLLVHPRDNDLVIGTHGRGVWIFDDIGPLQELADAVSASAHLFAPRDAIRFEPAVRRFRFDIGDRVFVGENPPPASVTYFLREGPAADEAESRTDSPPATDDESEADESEAEEEPRARIHLLSAAGDTIRTLEGPAERGLHRVDWDLRYGADEDEEDGFEFDVTQPRVLPGVYTVHLEVDGVAAPPPRRLEVVLDPRLSASPTDLREQLDALRRLEGLISRGVEAVRELDEVTSQLETWRDRVAEIDAKEVRDRASAGGEPPADSVGLAETAGELIEALATARRAFVPGEDDLASGLLREIRGLMGQIARATHQPTAPQAEWSDRYEEAMTLALGTYQEALDRVRAFSGRLEGLGLDAVEPR